MKDNKVSAERPQKKKTKENYKEIINPYNPIPEKDKQKDSHREYIKKSNSTSFSSGKITDVPKTDKPNDTTIKERDGTKGKIKR